MQIPKAPPAPDMRQELNSASRRMRLLEERTANLRRKIQLLEENMISQTKRVSADLKAALSEISDLRQQLSDFNDKAGEMMQNLEDVARKSDIAQIEHYLALWKPVDFVTQGEIEDIVKGIVNKMKHVK